MRHDIDEKLPEWQLAVRQGRDGSGQPKTERTAKAYTNWVKRVLKEVPEDFEGDTAEGMTKALEVLQVVAAPRSYHVYRVACLSFLRFLGYDGDTLEEQLPRTPPAGKARIMVPPDADVVAVLRADLRPADAAVVHLMAKHGLRIGEVASARWDSINWDDPSYWVHKAKQHGERYVPLQLDSVEVLRRLKALDRPGLWLFPSPGNPQKHVTVTSIRTHLARAWKAAGVTTWYRPHALRHWWATKLHRDPDVPDLDLSRLLGHSDFTTTMEYLHTLGTPELRAVVQAVDFGD